MDVTAATYRSPLGEMVLAAQGGRLIGVWFVGQRHFGSTIAGARIAGVARKTQPAPVAKGRADDRCLAQAADWLDAYFRGERPGGLPPMEPMGTDFQRRVWERLMRIPWGKTASYGEIAREVGSSPRAVGNAVGRNPLLLVVPCHRVVAADGSPGGYAAGEAVKRALLELEANRMPDGR